VLTLSEPEIRKFYPLVTAKKIVALEEVQRLERIFTSNDFAQALEFTNTVGKIAKAEDYHLAILTKC
jgi:4a-hydroxytetrahydrobiopterin dehydratase